jgi:hypothetical protein
VLQRAVLQRWSGRLGVDDAFEATVERAGSATVELDEDPWRD